MTARVFHAELWGDRQSKYEWLNAHDAADTPWKKLAPSAPFYLFVPHDTKQLDEYNRGWKITEAMPVNSVGIVTGQDAKTIAFDPQAADRLASRLAISSECVAPVLYRPFDQRFLVYHSSVVTRAREDVMRHMQAGENLGLITSRMTKGETFKHAQVTRNICEVICVSPKTSNNGFLFPLYLYPSAEAGADKLFREGPGPGKGGRRPNLSPQFVAEFGGKLGLTFAPDGAGDLKKTFGPEDVFHYAYGMFHSPTYRSRYAEFLKIDFPRLPLTGDRRLFARLCALGAELVGLHLLERVPAPEATYPQAGDSVVDKPRYKPPIDKTPGRVHVNAKQYFDDIPPEVWEFHVGGYQVCEKWLKDRKGRTLSYDEIETYRKITEALRRTIQLMREIDQAIPQWPPP